jgi:hypothetical protein
VGATGPLKDGGRGLGVRAQRGSSPAVSGAVARWGEREEGGRRKALTGGARRSERGRGRARGVAGCGEVGWGAAHAGEERERGCWASGGPCGREGKGRLVWAKAARLGCLFLFFSFFFYTLSIQTNLIEFQI